MKDLHENVRDKAWRTAILEFLKRGIGVDSYGAKGNA